MEFRRQSEHNIVEKTKQSTYLDIKIETSRGVLFAVRIINNQKLMAATVNDKSPPKKVDISEAHALFRHLSMKTLGWESNDGVIKCNHCAIARE
jgi:hypothetical protein